MEDAQILKLLWCRAENAIHVLAKKFGPGLFRIAMNILNRREDADECVNDTYLAIWNTIPPKKPDPLSGFVYKTGRNIALNRLRHENAVRRCSAYDLSLDELAACLAGEPLENQIDARLLGQAIDSFLDTVPKNDRILFLRRYWFGDSVKEIAASVFMTPNAVSVQLNRIRNKLKAYLIKEGFL